METKIHDYRYHDLASGKDGVVLIVRKGNRYGAAGPGERVRVDEAELLSRSTMEACMTEADFEKIRAERAAKEKAAAAPKKTPTAAIVDAGLARIAADAERKAKERAEREKAAPPEAPEHQPTKNTAEKGIDLYEAEAETPAEEDIPPAAPPQQPGGRRSRRNK